jgi:hypothetical protein
MTTRVTATVIGGLLKPDESLSLPDQTRVALTIEPIAAPPEPAAAWRAILDRLAKRPIDSGGRRFTRDELHERR